MLNIWQNNFYWKPPALSWLYVGDFNELCDWKNYASKFKEFNIDQDNNPLNKAIVSITIPDRECQMESIFYGGMEFPQLTRANNSSTVSIKFNEDNNYTISKLLEQYYRLFTFDPFYSISKGVGETAGIPYREYNLDTPPENEQASPPHDCSFSIHIFKYSGIANSNNSIPDDYCYSIKFDGCKLIKLDGFELNYESEDTITRTATFSFISMHTFKDINQSKT